MSVKKNFYSDNVSGAAPEILDALVAANAGDTAPYGADAITEGLPARFSALFETDVEVYPVGTGTAANGLCASIVAAPVRGDLPLRRRSSPRQRVRRARVLVGRATPARSRCRA